MTGKTVFCNKFSSQSIIFVYQFEFIMKKVYIDIATQIQNNTFFKIKMY